MALDTEKTVPPQGGHHARWSPEEDSVLSECWKEWVGPSGQARRGFLSHLEAIFPHRSKGSLRRRMSRLVQKGAVPKQWHRSIFVPISISDTEAAYLAAMLDGEGSIGLTDHADSRTGKTYHGKHPRLALCYNTDEGILQYVQSLVPCARRNRSGYGAGTDGRGIVANKQCYGIVVTGFRQIRDVLTRLLPFMCHIEKRKKAHAVIEFVSRRMPSGT